MIVTARLQSQSTTPQAPPAKVEISWDDALDGKFPPTRQQRFQQAAVQAVEQLHEDADVPVTRDRLTKALDLVLTNAVSLLPDGTARVRSGSHTYHLAPDCTCEDAQRRGKGCKHALAVLIHRRATALLESTAPAPAAPSVTPPAVVPAAADPATPCAPTSASWDVHEAPASACFRFRVGNLELMYTLRGIGDAELQARIKDTLPLLQDILAFFAYPPEKVYSRLSRMLCHQEEAGLATARPNVGPF